MGPHEPCQAGNRAALSGLSCAPQISCPPYAQQHTMADTAAPGPAFVYALQKGEKAVAYRALYRKWRPMRFEDVVGQQAIVTALQNQLRTGRIGHAYLFTGTRGTGKTTCAKIFAKAVNCPNRQQGDPCCQCEICRGVDDGSILDVVEIDAASNNGVDSIRDLRDETAYTPSVCQYKVYIIDEVHMLSIAAFNALLKIMEEPPPHIIFILATTEIHKVPATILSRCQRYDFGRIQPADIAARLEQVAAEEKIGLSGEAAQLIARLADGALRDALSILDTCAGVTDQVDLDTVRQMAGVTDKSYLFAISGAAVRQNAAEALAEVARLRQRSVDLRRLCEELIGHYRNLLLAGMPGGGDLLTSLPDEEERKYLAECGDYPAADCVRAVRLLGAAMEQMSRGADQRIELELALFQLCQPAPVQTAQPVQPAAQPLRQGYTTPTAMPPIGGNPAQPSGQPAPVQPVQQAEPAQPAPSVQPVQTAPPVQTMPPEQEPPAEAKPAAKAPAAQAGPAEPFAMWDRVVELLKGRDPLLYANLRDSRAYCDGRRVLIDGSEMFLEYIRKNDYSRRLLKKVIEETAGVRYGIGPYESAKKAQKADTASTEDTLRQLAALGVEIEVKQVVKESEEQQ